MPMKPQTRTARGSQKTWNSTRNAVLKRDNHRCRHCGIRNTDHILTYKPDPKIRLYTNHPHQFPLTHWKIASKVLLNIHHKDGNPANNNLDNLITLCPKCATTADRKLRKQNS